MDESVGLANIFIKSLLSLLMDHKKFMRLAINKGREGKIPFAACIRLRNVLEMV